MCALCMGGFEFYPRPQASVDTAKEVKRLVKVAEKSLEQASEAARELKDPGLHRRLEKAAETVTETRKYLGERLER